MSLKRRKDLRVKRGREFRSNASAQRESLPVLLCFLFGMCVALVATVLTAVDAFAEASAPASEPLLAEVVLEGEVSTLFETGSIYYAYFLRNNALLGVLDFSNWFIPVTATKTVTGLPLAFRLQVDESSETEVFPENAMTLQVMQEGEENTLTLCFPETEVTPGFYNAEVYYYDRFGNPYFDQALLNRAIGVPCSEWLRRRCAAARPGDMNNDGRVNIADLSILSLYLFSNGPSPVPFSSLGDVNGDQTVNVADVIHLSDFLFYDGEEPELSLPQFCP